LDYHIQDGNKDNFLSLDFSLQEFGILDGKESLRVYRRYVYEAGALDRSEIGKRKIIEGAEGWKKGEKKSLKSAESSVFDTEHIIWRIRESSAQKSLIPSITSGLIIYYAQSTKRSLNPSRD